MKIAIYALTAFVLIVGSGLVGLGVVHAVERQVKPQYCPIDGDTCRHDPPHRETPLLDVSHLTEREMLIPASFSPHWN